MAFRRLLLSDGGCYHVFSRVVDRRRCLGEVEREFFVATMRRLEAFLDVRVLTYCVMSNHFHILVEVPCGDEVECLTAESLRQRLPLLYQGKALVEARDEIDRALEHSQTASGGREWIDGIVARYQRRMGDLSVFLKELKWRFTVWFNDRSDRVGTLWEDRFHSVLVEGDELALMTMAAYIELNPIRAGIVGDPKDYRWCGYAEAVAGKKLARRRLARLHGRVRSWQGDGRMPLTWREVAAAYRMHLFGQGERRLGDGRSGRGAKAGMDPQQVASEVEDRGGELPVSERIRSRIRYFTEGGAIGSRQFVDGVFAACRDQFGSRRQTGARRMRGQCWKGLMSLRDLRGEVFGESGEGTGTGSE